MGGFCLNKNSTFKSILSVTLGNFTTILSGLVVGFFVPKILSLEGYGYYKSFTLYTSYVGLFSLGIIDGIVLRYGDKNLEELDRPLFRGIFKYYCLILSFFCLGMICAYPFFKDGNSGFILIMVAINMVGANISGYFQQISQITQRFREYTARKILQSVASIVIVLLLLLLSMRDALQGNVNYKIYLVLVVITNSLLAAWYIGTYKDIVVGESLQIIAVTGTLRSLIKCGVPLLISNMCSTLLLTLDRQFVNLLFSIENYAVYSFAYNLLSLVTVATSAVSTVLYPAMKRTEKSDLRNNYNYYVTIMLVFVCAMLSIYFPLTRLVVWFLPKYSESVLIFRVIFPGLALSSVITVIIHNYYKVFDLSAVFFRQSVVVLAVSAAANLIAYAIFKSMVSISFASIVTMVFWYFYTEVKIFQDCYRKTWKNKAYLLAMIILFYISTKINNNLGGFAIYFSAFLAISMLFFKMQLVEIVKGRR